MSSTRWSALFGLAILPLAASCRSPAAWPVCRVRPLHAGVCRLGADHVLGEGHGADERIPFVIYSFLVEGPNGETALVDIGPKSLRYTNEMFRRFGFFRDVGADVKDGARYPDDIVQPHGNTFSQLRAAGVALEEIDHVVFTHLHADHHGMHDGTDGGAAEDLPNALLHVSAKGWRDNLSRRENGQWKSYVDYAFSDFLLRREREGRVRFEDDAEIFPGLRTVYLGGHSVCSQGVVIDTADGPLIIASDDIYLYRLLEEDILPAIRTTRKNYEKAVRRLVELARRDGGVLVPLHDPAVWEAFTRDGPEWIATLRAASDRAVRGYLERHGSSDDESRDVR